MPNPKIETIHNIHDFLEEFNTDTFHNYARAVYKNGVGCWMMMVVETENGEERKIYYEDVEANLSPDQYGNVIGVEIGSIVEGSDVEVGPYRIDFPFKPEDWWTLVTETENEVEFYWVRDNSTWYVLRNQFHVVHGTFRRTNFEGFIWDYPETVSEELRKAAECAVNDHDNDLENEGVIRFNHQDTPMFIEVDEDACYATY